MRGVCASLLPSLSPGKAGRVIASLCQTGRAERSHRLVITVFKQEQSHRLVITVFKQKQKRTHRLDDSIPRS